MAWQHPTEADWDHAADYRKHDTDPLPARFQTPVPGAMEVAILVQTIPLAQGADLIEQYARTAAAAAKLDGVELAANRIMAAFEAPLTRKEPIDAQT